MLSISLFWPMLKVDYAVFPLFESIYLKRIKSEFTCI